MNNQYHPYIKCAVTLCNLVYCLLHTIYCLLHTIYCLLHTIQCGSGLSVQYVMICTLQHSSQTQNITLPCHIQCMPLVTLYMLCVLQNLHDNNPRPKGGPTNLDPLLIRGSAFAFLPGKPLSLYYFAMIALFTQLSSILQ